MATIPYDVADAFIEGRQARRGAFWSTGNSVLSYNLKLAQQTPEGPQWSIDPEVARRYSTTTSRHVRALLARLPYNEEDNGG